MKIIIRKQYGRIKPEVVKRYCDIKGVEKPFFYKIDWMSSVTINRPCFYSEENDLGPYYCASKVFLGAVSKEDTILFNDHNYDLFDFDRFDKDLIQTLEEGHHSILKAIEIPDYIEYEIKQNEYGCETIHEIGRVWE